MPWTMQQWVSVPKQKEAEGRCKTESWSNMWCTLPQDRLTHRYWQKLRVKIILYYTHLIVGFCVFVWITRRIKRQCNFYQNSVCIEILFLSLNITTWLVFDGGGACELYDGSTEKVDVFCRGLKREMHVLIKRKRQHSMVWPQPNTIKPSSSPTNITIFHRGHSRQWQQQEDFLSPLFNITAQQHLMSLVCCGRLNICIVSTVNLGWWHLGHYQAALCCN